MTKQVAAFFDIDGTLYRSSLLIEHFKKLIKHEIICPSVWHTTVKETFNNWDKRQGNYDEYLLEVCNVYSKNLKGISSAEIDVVANEVMRTKADKVYRYTRNQINWHLEQGHKVIFISGSPDFLVKLMAEKYHATDYIASQYLFNADGVFTGEVLPMWDSKSKNIAITNFVARYDISLEESYSYGDTNGDLSMMQLVGNPVAMNPAKELITAIKTDSSISEKAKIVIERKDVIYLIDSKNNTVEYL